SPCSRRTRASASSEACEPGPPSRASAGSPGISLRPKKMSVAIAHSTKAPPATRAATHRAAAPPRRLVIVVLAREPCIEEGRRRHRRQGTHALHRLTVQVVVLLVVEREHVVPGQHDLLRLLVEVGAQRR